MNNRIKGLVSKKKRRYQKEGFDLDLTYINSRIIAMGFPAQSFEGIFRNHIDDVVRFFDMKHGSYFKIYNLCKERQIDQDKFPSDNINHKYPFDDHNPPKFNQMLLCIEDICEYLHKDDKNVVAIQCKAGKGRTGVIVCAVLMRFGFMRTAYEALKFYGQQRTTNHKGVTIPSQIRYVFYYGHYTRSLSSNYKYKETLLNLDSIIIEDLPQIFGTGCELLILIYKYKQSNDCNIQLVYQSKSIELKKDQRTVVAPVDIRLQGDVKFEFMLKNKFVKREKWCHCWINTYFAVVQPSCTSLLDDSSSPSANGCCVDASSPQDRRNYNHSSSSSSSPCGGTFDSDSSSAAAAPSNTCKVTLRKSEIDKAHKDKTHKVFPKDFSISFFFSIVVTPVNLPPISDSKSGLSHQEMASIHKSPIYFDDNVSVSSSGSTIDSR